MSGFWRKIKMPEKVITELTSNEKRLVQQFHADFQWFAEHSHELSMKYKGKVVAVAHQELFVADSWEEAMRLAKEKYPEAQPVVMEIPRTKVVWSL